MTCWLNRKRVGLLVLMAMLTALVAACGWFGGSPLRSNDTLLRYVPADTPYVVAAVEPFPDEIMDAFAGYTASLGDFLQAAVQSAIDEINAANSRPGPDAFFADPPVDPQVAELLAELAAPATLEATGINRDSRSVLYGVGLLPVFRVTLAEGHDIGRVLDLLAALIEQDGEVTVATASIAGQDYRYIDVAPARLIAAVLDNELVVTAVPAGFGDAELQSVLGLVLPEPSIADSGRLAAIADEYAFTPSLVSMLDVERLAATFLGQPNATDAALFELAGFAADSIPPVCRDELRGLAGVAPLIVGGYTELNANLMAANAVIELREDIAAGLARLPTAVPGMGAMTDAMISLGLGLDMPRAREFAAARLDAIAADPFECEMFAGLQESIPDARMMLAQPLPPPADSLKGVALTIDLGDIDLAGGPPLPSEMEVTALIATDDVAGTIATLSTLDPTIAALDLQADGQIVELPFPAAFAAADLGSFGAAFMVATDTAIGMGLGLNSRASLEQLMNAPASDPSSFFRMSLDLARYYGLMADLMDDALFLGVSDAPSIAAVSAMSELMRSIQQIYTRETFEIRFTGRGIEMPVSFDLAESGAN